MPKRDRGQRGQISQKCDPTSERSSDGTVPSLQEMVVEKRTSERINECRAPGLELQGLIHIPAPS